LLIIDLVDGVLAEVIKLNFNFTATTFFDKWRFSPLIFNIQTMNKCLLVVGTFLLFLFSCSKKIIPMNSIPMKYDGYINLDVNVGEDIRGNFIFDTGWNGISFDSMFCKKNRLSYKTTDIEAIGIGNLRRTVQLITDTIHFQFSSKEHRFSTKSAMLDLKNMVGAKIDGIAGVQTFANKPYMIDYESQKIVFIDSVKGYNLVEAKFEGDFFYLNLSIILKNKNKIQGWFLLDTGSNQTMLNSHIFMTDGIYNSADKKKFFAKGGVGGDSNGYFLPVSIASLGNFKLKNLIMTISTDTFGMLANPNYIGIIGNDLLDDFNMIFDHQKGKIWVKPNKNFNKNINKLFKGISFLDTGEKWMVAGIVEETDAFRKGIRMNDEILQINNIQVEKIDLDTFVENLEANDILLLKIKQENGEKEIEFKLNVFIES